MYPWEYVTISILRFKPTSLYVFVSLIRQVCDVPAVLLTITKSSERERVMFEIPIKPRNGERRIVYLDIVSWKADLFAAALSEIQSLWKSFAITSVINIIFPFIHSILQVLLNMRSLISTHDFQYDAFVALYLAKNIARINDILILHNNIRYKYYFYFIFYALKIFPFIRKILNMIWYLKKSCLSLKLLLLYGV